MAHMARLWMVAVLMGCKCVMASYAWLTPRTSFPIDADGSSARVTAHFSDLENATTLLLGDDGATLYVGARNAVLSLNVSQPGVVTLKHKFEWAPSQDDLKRCSMISGEKDMGSCNNYILVLQLLSASQLYVCGTHAFQPHDTLIDTETLKRLKQPAEAKGHCPFSPVERNAAISVDGEMYVATTSDYKRTPSISRFLSNERNDVKLENPRTALEEPNFIKSSAIRGEEKVYFFFTESNGNEYHFMSKLTISRVAQVCKDDVGGKYTLQKRWTTFAKAQLVCQQGNELPFNVLQDIEQLPPSEGDSSDDIIFYGIFSSQWSLGTGVSAVCAFKLQEIKAAFSGNYRTWEMDRYTRQTDKSVQFGKCGLPKDNSMPLDLVKKTFLTEKNVQAMDQKMVLLSPDQKYSRIVGQRTKAANGQTYTVLFLLSESGYLHKVVLLESGPHIIEEIQVFRSPQTVKNIILSISTGMVFVGSPEGVSQVPVSNCSFYQTCAECVMVRDPFCAWDPSEGICARVSTILSDVRQDVEHGNTTEQCKSIVSETGPQEKELYQEFNRLTVLRCPKPSSQSLLTWRFSNNTVLPPGIYFQPGDGILVFVGSPLTAGRYRCVSVEQGLEQTVAIFSVKQGVTPRGTGSGQKFSTTQSGKSTLTTTGSKTSVASGLSPGPTTGTSMTSHSSVTQEPEGYVITRQIENEALSSASAQSTQNGKSSNHISVEHSNSYYGALVAISVLLAVCVLLLGALYWWHQTRLHKIALGFSDEKDPCKGTLEG